MSELDHFLSPAFKFTLSENDKRIIEQAKSRIAELEAYNQRYQDAALKDAERIKELEAEVERLKDLIKKLDEEWDEANKHFP